MKHVKLFSMLLTLWLAASRAFAQQAVNIQDSLALVDFYDSTNGSNWLENYAWKNGPVETWYGVTVEGGRVSRLSFFGDYNRVIGSIPESFGNLTKLQVLDLLNNSISSLPASFGRLTNLQSLVISGDFRSLPASFGNLTNLLTLWSLYNQLSSLPESFGNLTNLQDLDLGDNHIRSLPESFGNLTNLQRLNIRGNLRSLPESIGNLTKLHSLGLGNNLLRSLPASFGNLKNLSYLELYSNQLSSLPASFWNITKLQALELQNNQLSALPESIGKLTNLSTLVLNGNKLSALPASLWNMTKLQSLYLADNQLSSVPESIGNLTNLQQLFLESNQLNSLPVSLGRLIKLWRLHLSNNQLIVLPASFGNLTNLQELALNNNQLSALPASFGNLTKVYWLDLSNNQLSVLPESFGNLRELSILSLSNNQLSALPASFGNLLGLDFFNLSVNKFIFAGLEWTIKSFPPIVRISYTPQDTLKLTQAENTLIASVGGTPENNTFYWYRNDKLDTTIKADSTYTPVKPGRYRVEAKNAIAKELTIHSEPVDYLPDCDDCIWVWYRDADGDGFGNPNTIKEAKEQPRGYVSNDLDCNDKNKTKGGPEVCDGIDNDCDGIIDDGLTETLFYSDFDGDGYGSDKRTITTCAAPLRFIAVAGDCNDDNKNVYPNAPELCDGRDNDCNGKIDDWLSLKPFYWDGDKDGYGFFRPVYACAAPPGYISQGGGCKDNNPAIHPGATEHCDGIDEDCNGIIDDGFPQKRYYKDRDGDGWGSNSNLMAGCAPAGYVEKRGDCNDTDPSIHPGARGSCNGKDDDCDGKVDEDCTQVTTQQGKAGEGVSEQGLKLAISAVPNPATHYFTLRISSNNTKPVQLRVLDQVGRVIEAKHGTASNSTFAVGHNYRPGVYVAEVLQEGRKATVKLVKGPQ